MAPSTPHVLSLQRRLEIAAAFLVYLDAEHQRRLLLEATAEPPRGQGSKLRLEQAAR